MTGTASGKFVAQHINEGDVPDTQIQPNGVDLTIGAIFATQGNAEFTKAGYRKPNRKEVDPVGGPGDSFWRLHDGGVYVVKYAEKIEIPPRYVGRVYPRSRLMRCGLHLTSALWDQGYEGVGEGQLQVGNGVKAEISRGVPIAQIVFEPADEAPSYDGYHQGESLSRFAQD